MSPSPTLSRACAVFSAAVLASALWVTAPGAVSAASPTVDFEFTGGAQTWVVPAGVTSVTFDVYGAAGADTTGCLPVRGLGGRSQATVAVTPGDEIEILVGGQGASGDEDGGVGGFNGGGDGGVGNTGGGGGGASDVRIGGDTLGDRIIVAGGGGGVGGGCNGAGDGGSGGGEDGVDGGDPIVPGPTGGEGATTASAGLGGLPDGLDGSTGQGGDGGIDEGRILGGGGAGGGLFGGGGGGSGVATQVGPGGGGGGSGLCPSTCDEVDQGVRDGDGLVTVSYDDEPSPTTTAVTVRPAATPAAAVAARPRFTG